MWQLFLKSCQENFIFFISLIYMIIALSVFNNKNNNIFENLIIGWISYLICVFGQYYSHYIAHKYQFRVIIDNFLKENKNIKKIIPEYFLWGMYQMASIADFHHDVHHNSIINNSWKNIFIEFIQNLYFQGIGSIIFLKLLNFGIQINKKVYELNYSIFFAMSILYATIHQINYKLLDNINETTHYAKCHHQHHLNNTTNYGIDFIDIILNTKYDMEIELMNHGTINVVLITLFVLFLQ